MMIDAGVLNKRGDIYRLGRMFSKGIDMRLRSQGGMQLYFRMERRCFMKKRIISLFLAIVLCFSLGACGADAVIDDIVDQTANIVQSENENVLAIKGATNSNYPGVTYGEAFEDFFGLPAWKSFKGTQEGPDDDGDGEPDYTLDDVDVVEFTGTCTYQDVEVKALIQFTLDNDEGTFEATYLSFNEVPQSTFVLVGLLSKVFESYMEKHNISPTENTSENISEAVTHTDTEQSDSSNASNTNTEESDSSDASNTNESVYDYEAMKYAGSYAGFGGYSISFSAYSSVEDDEIGVAEIYYDGEFVSRYPVCICTDRGDWSDSDYEQFYVMYCDGYNEYLGFHESEGNYWLDYNGPDRNYDILEMTEHYES